MAAALACTAVLTIVIISSGSGDGSGSKPAAANGSGPKPPSAPAGGPLRLTFRESQLRLPAPVSGEVVTSQSSSLLVIGGLDGRDVSTSSVLRFDPRAGTIASAGSLSQPLHDAAATAIAGGVLVFGGGSATTIDEVERLAPGRAGEVVGHLPQSRSDLTALTVGGSAVVLGGYDGAGPVSPVLETRDGRSFTTVANLPVAVRYASVTARGQTIFVLGGELADGSDSADIQAVDLANGSAKVVGHLPRGLSHSSAVELGGRTFLLGGRLDGQTTDQVLRFDPARTRAQRVGRLPAPVQNAAAGAVAGAGFLLGGLDPKGTPLSAIVAVRLSPPAPPAPSP